MRRSENWHRQRGRKPHNKSLELTGDRLPGAKRIADNSGSGKSDTGLQLNSMLGSSLARLKDEFGGIRVQQETALLRNRRGGDILLRLSVLWIVVM
jgi:hypothetical protein